MEEKEFEKKIFAIRAQILAARQFTIYCIVAVFVFGLLGILLFPSGSLLRAIFQWSGLLIIIPIFYRFERIRCPICGMRPFIPMSRTAFRYWRENREVSSSICVNCGNELIDILDETPKEKENPKS